MHAVVDRNLHQAKVTAISFDFGLKEVSARLNTTLRTISKSSVGKSAQRSGLMLIHDDEALRTRQLVFGFGQRTVSGKGLLFRASSRGANLVFPARPGESTEIFYIERVDPVA